MDRAGHRTGILQSTANAFPKGRIKHGEGASEASSMTSRLPTLAAPLRAPTAVKTVTHAKLELHGEISAVRRLTETEATS